LPRVSGDPIVHEWEHLLVTLDHRDDHVTPKCVKFRVIQLEARLHFAERGLSLVIR
jgi:hypothetical protein